MSLKNVVLVGASGSVGAHLLKRLDTADLNLKVLRRNGSKSTFPSHIRVVDVDFDSVESLASALSGQDAVVSAIATEQVGAQANLIEAAVSAGVKRFVPSEFGSNLSNEKSRRLPVFRGKVQIQDVLVEKSKTTDLTYTFVYSGPFLDWGLQYNFLLKHSGGPVTIIDGGDTTFSTTTLPSVAEAVYGILKHPEETKNRTVYIEDAKVTQNKLLELARKAAPGRSWETEHASLDALTDAADKRLAQGLLDFQTFGPYLYRAIFGAENGSDFEENDNELLGLKAFTEEEVLDVVKQYVK